MAEGTMQDLRQDLSYAIRMLLRKPMFTAVAVLALGLGIGANTVIFSAANAVLLRSLPYDEADRLVWIWENNAASDIKNEPTSFPNFYDLRSQNESFEDMAAFSSFWLPILVNEGEPERLPASLVSGNIFSLLHVEAAVGRTFLPEEDQPGRNRVVVLSHGLWTRRFASDPGVIGRTITLNSNPYIVVGVLPASFQQPTPDGGKEAQLWAPLGLNPNKEQRRWDFLNVIARLKPSVSIAQARAEMATISARLGQQYTEANAGWSVTVIPLHERFVGDVRTSILVLVVAVGFLLLIACANVANLLLVRSAGRQREIAIRSALGASRGRLIRQFITESLVLALMGGVFGILLALSGIQGLRAISPGNIPRINEAGIDLRVLGFTLLISLLTGIIFSLAPAMQDSNTDLNDSLKEGGRGTTDGPSGMRFRSLLAITEVTLAVVLLIGASLMIRSFVRLQSVDPGFSRERMLTVDISLPRAKYRETYQVASFIKSVLERVDGIAGVEAAATATTAPLSNQAPTLAFTVEGRPVAPGMVNEVQSQVVSPSYFRTLGIPLLRGRVFTDDDSQKTQHVVIINEVAAQRYFLNEDPIGKNITLDDAKPGTRQTIVGIVANVRQIGSQEQLYPQVYEAYAQKPSWINALIIRAASDPVKLIAPVRSQVMAVDQNQPLYKVRTMNEVLAESVSRPRFNTQLISVLTAVALALTIVGIYGVISYSVSHRFQEIGLRMALGAQQSDILKMIMAQGFRLAVAGITAGTIIALILTRLMTSLLYEVSATDPLTFIAVPVIIAAVVLAACYIPARRAAKVEPVIALRSE